MIKLFFLFILVSISCSVLAQHTTPRTGVGVKYDPRNLGYAYLTKTDAASATIDTFSLASDKMPNAWRTIYRIVLVDSLCAGNPAVTNSYAGDEIEFIISAASGTPFLRFIGTNWVTAGTATMTTRLRSIIKFVFDGAKWVESGRYTQ